MLKDQKLAQAIVAAKRFDIFIPVKDLSSIA